MPQEKVVDRRLKLPCVSYSVYFIDFANEEVYRLTRDNWGGMTIYNEGNSPFLWAFKNSENIPVDRKSVV